MKAAPEFETRLYFTFPILFLIILTLSSPAGGSVSETLTRHTYPARQGAGTSLLAALNDASPVREGGKVFHGYTKWNVKWDYRWNESRTGACTIASVATNLRVEMTLPDLVAGSAEGVAMFRRYLAALVIHEEGHRDIGREAAEEVDRTIAALPGMANCRELEREANRRGEAIIARARTREKEYDRTTSYGCTQGACLSD